MGNVEYMNYFVEQPSVEEFIKSAIPPHTAEDLHTKTKYDSVDRVLEVILPDNSVQTNNYRIENDRFVNESIDPMGNKTIQYKDGRDNILEVVRYGYNEENKSEAILSKAQYTYNILGEMLSAKPQALHNEKVSSDPIEIRYDMLGRRESIASGDTGEKQYVYSDEGLLHYESDSNLREKGSNITYIYDGFGRITTIDYPFMSDTKYTYGRSGTANAGKVTKIEDVSGSITYEYGKLGEVVSEERIIKHIKQGLGSSTQSATMSYVSDYLGRMQSITYPDTETITYGYDTGGQVISVTGQYGTLTTKYVEDIGYDEYGQRLYIEYGNGVRTDYTYDDARRWLDSIKTHHSKTNLEYQNIIYKFDTVGNVKEYTNTAGNYSTKQNYEYDDLYQLISANGTSTDTSNGYEKYKSTYAQTYSFDSLGNMLEKNSNSFVTDGNVYGDNLNYSLDYEYYSNKTHRVKRIGDRYYSYDANGNVVLERDDKLSESETEQEAESQFTVQDEGDGVYSAQYGWALEQENSSTDTEENKKVYQREYEWNEKNELVRSTDSITVNYRYGSDGQRAVKSSPEGETLYFNTMWSYVHNQKIYGIHARVSKNIYLGSTRIATRINGVGDLENEGGAKVGTYYYHSDHLGSAQLVTNHEGAEHERIEYTPYGETWIEKREALMLAMPYKFTGKELDEETGLYYYGARYLDPKTSRWLSTDPALKDYLKGDSKGAGGIYNYVNFNLYHYGGNNPIKYNDPTGEDHRIGGMLESPAKQYDDSITIEYLKSIVNESYVDGASKGAAANDLRGIIRTADIDSLFKEDESFMNEELRDFLNLNLDGTSNYALDELTVDNGWTELSSIGSMYHQTNASAKEGLNAKFIHADGREVVIAPDGTVVQNYPDKGTYNYAQNAKTPFGEHKRWDIAPYNKSMANKGLSVRFQFYLFGKNSEIWKHLGR